MIDKDSFIMYAMKAYDNPSCKTLDEFEFDLFQFNTLAKLCKKEIDEELVHKILNQILILLNNFENKQCIEMMFFKVKKSKWSILKTMLVFLCRMPDEVQNVKSSEIELCKEMIDPLRKI